MQTTNTAVQKIDARVRKIDGTKWSDATQRKCDRARDQLLALIEEHDAARTTPWDQKDEVHDATTQKILDAIDAIPF